MIPSPNDWVLNAAKEEAEGRERRGKRYFGDPFPEELLDAEDRGSSAEEEVKPTINPVPKPQTKPSPTPLSGECVCQDRATHQPPNPKPSTLNPRNIFQENMFVKTGPLIDPMYDGEYRELQVRFDHSTVQISRCTKGST